MCHLLPDERHSLGGLRHLLGNEEEEDSLGQENIDGDGAFLPTRCQEGQRQNLAQGSAVGIALLRQKILTQKLN